VVSNFLFSRANREFLIFLFFLALSGVFWLLMTLNETYEQEVRIPVQYVNVPNKVVITSGETDTLRVTVSDKGIILAAYLYSEDIQPILVDFKTYAHASTNTGSVPQSDLKKQVLARLTASSKIVGIKPERLSFTYNNGERKRVPILYSGQVTPDDFYFMAGVDYLPDSATIYATREKLDSINAVYTEPLNYSNVRDTLTVQVRLRRTAGVKMVPETVSVRFRTDVLTEGRIDNIPIMGINMPEGKILRTFPAKVGVNFVTGINQLRTMTAADFEVVADYNEIKDSPSSTCRISLLRFPKGITRERLDTTFVEYLIEE
jgi:hypothetical protein